MLSAHSLPALRAFAEAGRVGSMKAAAASLGVTPGAVSQQIKLLEARLGLALFERGHREIRLTAAGRRLLEPLVEGFARIAAGLAAVEPSRPTRHSLTVSTSASFAASWLVPRLGAFMARCPSIEVRLETTSRLVDLRRDNVDVALRHGLGDYPGLTAIKLLSPQLVALASPGLLSRGPTIVAPRDCLAYPLLQDSGRADWRLWLAAHGVVDRRASRGPSFEDDYLAVRAAVAGQGIALVRDVYGGAEIAAGELVRVLDLPTPTRFAYYVVIRPETARQTKIARFRDWIVAAASAEAPRRPARRRAGVQRAASAG